MLSSLTTSRKLLQSLAVVAGILHKLLPEESVSEARGVIYKAVGVGE